MPHQISTLLTRLLKLLLYICSIILTVIPCINLKKGRSPLELKTWYICSKKLVISLLGKVDILINNVHINATINFNGEGPKNEFLAFMLSTNLIPPISSCHPYHICQHYLSLTWKQFLRQTNTEFDTELYLQDEFVRQCFFFFFVTQVF